MNRRELPTAEFAAVSRPATTAAAPSSGPCRSRVRLIGVSAPRPSGERRRSGCRRRARSAPTTRPLCVTMIFCTSASPSPVPRARVVTNGRKMRDANGDRRRGRCRRPRCARARCAAIRKALDGDARRDARVDAGFERVAAQVAEHLPQQDLVSHRPARARRGRVTEPPRETASARISSAARSTMRRGSTAAEHEVRRLREVQEVAARPRRARRSRRGCPGRRDARLPAAASRSSSRA